jgi:uncharacterized protein YjgD (DUF1641 family)
MAEPIQAIVRPEKTEQEQETESLEQLLSTIAQHRDGLEETISLLHELHSSGLLEALHAMLAAREQVTKILVEQASRPEATAIVNNLMVALGGLAKLNPEVTSSVMNGLSEGVQTGREMVKSDRKLGVFDLVKAIKDPDVNRTLKFAIGFLGGFGKAVE